MKKLLFLLLGLAVAVSASANVTKASIQKNVKPLTKNTVRVSMLYEAKYCSLTARPMFLSQASSWACVLTFPRVMLK